jgi:Putative MetA-pathway of phenol degradation
MRLGPGQRLSAIAARAASASGRRATGAERIVNRRNLSGVGLITVLWLAPAGLGATSAHAESTCPGTDSAIATDRPDVTNSSLVVPAGSLQNENGVNLTARASARIADGTNSRLRLGVAPCLELLLDLPTYVGRLRGQASSGFSNAAPAVKWQLSPLPGDIELSVTAGIGLPTGTTRVTGPGAQPYLQLPWSRELGDGWSVSGMVTAFFFPSEPKTKRTTEPTLVLEKALGERADVFIEYVGEYPAHAGPSHLFNSGGVYRLTPTQQIDFHAGFGLNDAAPSYVFGIGYSIRFDGLF